MSATVAYLMYRTEWHRRRSEALRARAGFTCQARTCCKIYWAADTFVRARTGKVGPAPAADAWRDPCTAADLQSDSD